MNKSTRITIETAANGYIAHENAEPCCVTNPYVFETFAALAEWLGSRLKRPEMVEQAGQAVTANHPGLIRRK